MPFLKNRAKIQPQWKTKELKTYKNGIRHSIFKPHGDRYIGEWRDNKRGGKGAVLTTTGKQYEGDWKEGMRHGFGVLSNMCDDENFDLEYYGFWVRGKKQGFGAWVHNGGFYEGSWYEDKRCGYGRMWFADGTFYEGEWHNDKFHGSGMFIYANANRYEGQWRDGKKHGEGVFYHLVSGQQQKGVWENDTAVMSIMSDITWRQTAILPTPYPIPKMLIRAAEEGYLAAAVPRLRELRRPAPQLPQLPMLPTRLSCTSVQVPGMDEPVAKYTPPQWE